MITIAQWLLAKLEPLSASTRIVVRDPLRLLVGAETQLHDFATQHAFTVIVAAANLVFRDLYERALADGEIRKILVIDRSSVRQHTQVSAHKAPPPFYPDLLAQTPPEAQLDLDLREYLRETTGDPAWPQRVNDPRYARLIAAHLDEVRLAHQALLRVQPGRFTDADFDRIVAFAAVGVGSSAFKRLDADDYWRIGLEGYAALDEVQAVVPEVARTIKDELRLAPAPFCWLPDHPQDLVIRALYLSVILAQHTDDWPILLAALDPAAAALGPIAAETLREATAKLVKLDPDQARRDLERVEQSLDTQALQRLLVDRLQLNTPAGFAAALERERYSTLIRSLALLFALDALLSGQGDRAVHERIVAALFADTLPQEKGTSEVAFADSRPSPSWATLREAYRLAWEIQGAREMLARAIREAGVKPKQELTFAYFWQLWNGERINRLEFQMSALRRQVETGHLLPREASQLPPGFGKAAQGVTNRTRQLGEAIGQQLDELNRPFQSLVEVAYPAWLVGNTDVCLTSQFLQRCVKPQWDPAKEQAVVFVFDGMRYDIWDELLRPMLEDRLELVDERMGCSLLPSETHISRWALAAGQEPREYLYPHKAESAFLQPALKRVLNYDVPVHALAGDGANTGQTVHYRAGNLDYYIFEICDKELHKTEMHRLPDGRFEPSRPLTSIYQILKDLIDNEVMAIIRKLTPGTRVFITADHGFGPSREQAITVDNHDINDFGDCKYRNVELAVPYEQAQFAPQVRSRIIAFTPSQLGMPKRKPYKNVASGKVEEHEIKAVLFPRVGYAFSRRTNPTVPAAFSHGGISIQELMVPMVSLRVKPPSQGQELLALEAISGPSELVEGTEVEFSLRLHQTTLFGPGEGALKVEVEATCGGGEETTILPKRILFVSPQGVHASYALHLDRAQATPEEQRAGRMERTLTITATYREGWRVTRKARTHRFTVQLNAERIARRVPANLGSLLGLMPKNLD